MTEKTEFAEEQHYDAILDDWFIWNGMAHGRIRSDKKGRFEDGDVIHTSRVLTPVDQIEANTVIKTRNSSYLLGSPIK